MALLKTLAPLFMGAGMSRAQASAMGVQLVTRPVPWSKKPSYIRNQPYTAVRPHEGQIQTRIHFGRLAKECKGMKGFGEGGLPIVAAELKTRMKGFRAPAAMSKEMYPSKLRRTLHTVEELEAMLRGTAHRE